LLRSRHLICVRVSGVALIVVVACWPGQAMAQAEASPSEGTTTASAPAEPAPAPDPISHPAVVDWYGWQTLVSDLLGVGVVALGIVVGASGSGGGAVAVISLGMAGLWLVPPAIHLVHHNRWSLGSLLIRTAAVGLVIGGTVRTAACFSGGCDAGPVLLVTGLTALLGIVVADAILGREPEEPPRVSLAPWGDPQARAGGLNLSGSW
jgi:hypothetical protein